MVADDWRGTWANDVYNNLVIIVASDGLTADPGTSGQVDACKRSYHTKPHGEGRSWTETARGSTPLAVRGTRRSTSNDAALISAIFSGLVLQF